MRPAKIALIVGGALLALFGLGLTAAGGTLMWAHATPPANTPPPPIGSKFALLR